ncbi:hypothetical protein LTR41_010201 [Exophiala xenobiotica]|nr:hypothetical protein LTR41_010201 [Exophiala xenobiotica]
MNVQTRDPPLPGELSFEYGGKKVHLIDTPGFNDSHRSESDVLEEICYWLSTAYGPRDVDSSKRFLLNGIIYLHPLTEQKWTGTSQRSIDFLKALCGSENYSCISLATSFWDQTTPAKGMEHERQLVDHPSRWGAILEKPGTRTHRHDSGYRSAIRIIASIIQKNTKYALRIQKELSQPDATLLDTTVGRMAHRAWEADIESFQAQLDHTRDNLHNLRSSRLDHDITSMRTSLANRENAVALLTLNQPTLSQRWTARNTRDNELMNQQLEQCNQAIITLQRQLENQQHGAINISIHNNDSASSIAESEVSAMDRQLKMERQKQKDLMAKRMAKMTSKSMKAGIAGSMFGAVSMGVGLLPLALIACCVM